MFHHTILRYRILHSSFFTLHLLNRLSGLVSLPEIRHPISIDIIRMLLVIASHLHQFDDLLGCLMRKRLPETSRHSCYQRRGKRGAVIIDDGPSARNHGSRTSKRHHIRFDAPVGSRSHGTESSILALLVDAAHSKNILGVGRKIDFLPHTHTIIAGRIHADDSLVGTHRGRMGNQCRLAILFPV